MSSYAGWHAELYDLFYADKPYEREAAFLDGCLRECSAGPVTRLLEVACGTGRHALALERLGYQVLATDASRDMLAVAEQRAKAAKSNIEFCWADMRDLPSIDVSTPSPERHGGRSLQGAARDSFDAVICLFDSLGYAVTNEGVQQTLRGVADRLRQGGVFVCEFWHAAAMLSGYDPVRVRRIPTPEGEVLRISETSLNAAMQTCSVTYSVYDLRRDGTYRTLTETQTNRFFSIPEMGALFAQAGLEPLHWFAGFTRSETISATDWHIVAVARKQK